MAGVSDLDRHLARQARLVAVVIAVTVVAWLAGQWLGGRLGWQARYAFLFDLAALAAFFWALVVTFRVWYARRANGGPSDQGQSDLGQNNQSAAGQVAAKLHPAKSHPARQRPARQRAKPAAASHARAKQRPTN